MNHSNTTNAPIGATQTTPEADEALHFRSVYEHLNYKCKTGHTALNLARKGLIRAIRINARTIRYSKRSVLALIAGKEAA